MTEPNFFEVHSRFFQTSSVGAWPMRLALRHEAIIESNRTILEGAHVLDLASHDGRWTFAALNAGAAHVTGVEVREHLIEAARANMEAYAIDSASYTFLQDDLNHKTKAPVRCDVALCLGYFYHTLNHLALMEYLASTSARHLILDGAVEPGDEDIIRIYAEDSARDANGATEAGVHEGRVLVGYPTVKVLSLMLKHFGYKAAVYDWSSLIAARGVTADHNKPPSADNPVGDYARKARATIVAERVDGP